MGAARKPPSRPRMSDVAAFAGVATKTVSRVVNDEPNVTEETKAKVLAAIAELGYQRDHFAGNLRRLDRRTHSIGLLFGAPDNPFSREMAIAVEQAMTSRRILVLISSLNGDVEREIGVVNELLRRRVDGFIVTTATQVLPPLALAQSQETPVVFVDGPALGMDADSVVGDNSGGASLGTRHLLERGHRRIAFLGPRRDVYTVHERHSGFAAELSRWGIQPDPDLIVEDLDEDSAAEVTVRMATSENPPDAIFSAQNLCSLGVVRGLRRVGAQNQIAVVGFDDVAGSDLIKPGLTVIEQDPKGLGDLAAETLLRRIDGSTSPFTTTVLPTRLIERGSGEIRPDVR